MENLANLARIELSEEEKKNLLSDMDSILEYVKQIESVKVGETKEEYKTHNIWREDLPAVAGKMEIREFSRELILGQFPDAKDGFLKVKKIL